MCLCVLPVRVSVCCVCRSVPPPRPRVSCVCATLYVRATPFPHFSSARSLCNYTVFGRSTVSHFTSKL